MKNLKCFTIFIGETPEGVPHKRPASDENEEEEEEDQGEFKFRLVIKLEIRNFEVPNPSLFSKNLKKKCN